MLREGYTRTVTWKQRISVVVLLVVAAVPLSRTVCAIACDSPTNAASAHHGSKQGCDEPTQPASGVRIQDVSHHDCAHHVAAVLQVATIASQRTHLPAAPLVFANAGHTTHSSRIVSGSIFEHTYPPGTRPPATAPRILRV